MTIAPFGTPGTQTAVIGTEHVLASPNVVGKFLPMVDLTNLAAGDRLELREKKKVLTGGTAVSRLIGVFEGAQPVDDRLFVGEWLPNSLTDTDAVSYTLKQTFGTGRAFPWVVFRESDQADVTKWSGTAVAAPDTAGYAKVTIKDGTGTGELDTASGKVALKDASFGAATLDGTFTFVTAPDVAAAVWDESLAGHVDPGSSGLSVQDIDIAAAAVKVKTDQLVFSTASRVDSQVFGMEGGVVTANAIASNAIGAAELAADAGTEIAAAVWNALRSGFTTPGTMGEGPSRIESGVATGTPTTTTMAASALPSVADNQYSLPNPRSILFTSGVNIGKRTVITGYTNTGRVLTFNALTTAPTAGDTFLIL